MCRDRAATRDDAQSCNEARILELDPGRPEIYKTDSLRERDGESSCQHGHDGRGDCERGP